MLFPEECQCHNPCCVMSGLQNYISWILERCDLTYTITNILVHRSFSKKTHLIVLEILSSYFGAGWNGRWRKSISRCIDLASWIKVCRFTGTQQVFLLFKVTWSNPGAWMHMSYPNANEFWCGNANNLN